MSVPLASGGGTALVFIVLLVIGIASLMAVYLASAVVVLDRFARLGGRRSVRVASGAAVAVVAAWLAVDVVFPERSATDPVAPTTVALFVLGALVATALAMACVARLLHAAPPRRLAETTGLAVALGLALASAGTGFAILPGALILPPLLFCAVALLRGRRPGVILRSFAGRLAALVVVAGSLVWLPGGVVSVVGAVGEALLAVAAALVLLGLLPHAIAGFVDMRRSAEWFIASRYLVAKRRQVFISAITGICVLGIAAGVWLIIVVLSVMNGFEQTWRDEILGDRAHFVVLRDDGPIEGWAAILERVRAVPGVVAAAPYLDADAMVRGRGDAVHSLRLRGIDPDAVRAVSHLDTRMVVGSLDALQPDGWVRDDADLLDEDGAEEGETGPPAPPILIGNQLAASLGVGVGDRLLVISPMGGPPTPMGPAPRLARFEVAGLFTSSTYQYDEVYAYVSIPEAQAFRRSGPVVDGVEAVTSDHYRSLSVGREVAAALGAPFFIRDWKEYFPAFFQALRTERMMMAVLLGMIMVVAAFIIVATLVMMIMEKSSDIAILKAMGAPDELVERVFALEGTMIGLLGTGLGVLAGLAVVHRLGWIQDRIESLTGVDALPSTVDQLASLPSRVDPVQVATVVGLAMVLSLGATLIPSLQGARIDPAEGLRHE